METKSKAIAAMVLGICSLVFCWLGLIPLVAGIIAIVLGAKGLKYDEGKGMSIAGLVTGIIGTIISFIYTLIWLLVVWGISAGSVA